MITVTVESHGIAHVIHRLHDDVIPTDQEDYLGSYVFPWESIAAFEHPNSFEDNFSTNETWTLRRQACKKRPGSFRLVSIVTKH